MQNLKKIAFLAGARPNYMKVFPVWKAVAAEQLPLQPILIHTGQHYDELMSGVFFRDFEMEKPTHFLGVGSGPHGLQTAKVIIALEELFKADRPDILVVVGDVNSTMAGALVATKMGIPVVHVESGLRSFDRTMPEEINRIVTDSISDLLLTSCRDADAQLLREGIPASKIRFVGNVMIDSLVTLLPKAEASRKSRELGVEGRPFILVTLHRPSNVDDPARLKLLIENLDELGRQTPIVFPVHPRTRKMMEQSGLFAAARGLTLTDPLSYLDFMGLEARAALVITDSGGVQEETSYLGIPCLTVRPNTERPVTVTEGTNRLLDPSTESLSAAARAALQTGRR
ncbi:MAG TPA: UDP-N-acetylglucosamine 2-epimerase (non-hydrolyzing), partial [Clostridia bacterium]|nr:UDP-N-acetylglucosamine 2-epimerase (non-hydrolyzing) [Clostridia bacterium]